MNQKQALQEVLKGSSLHVCLMLVAKVLTRTGYGDIQVLGRRHRLQKSRVGGCELQCHTSMGSVPIRVIIKLIKDSVRTRMLDEMAGAIDRTKSDFGIVVSTEKLSEKARRTRKEYKKSRVEIIDLCLLTEMLQKFRIGVRPGGEIDYAFFAAMEDQFDRVNEFLAYERFTR